MFLLAKILGMQNTIYIVMYKIMRLIRCLNCLLF